MFKSQFGWDQQHCSNCTMTAALCCPPAMHTCLLACRLTGLPAHLPACLPTFQPTQLPAHPTCVFVLSPVNQPGYFYSVTAAGVPSATPCGPDSYSPGWKKQRACVPCPSGFTTAGVVEAKSPTACGMYLIADAHAEQDAAADVTTAGAATADCNRACQTLADEGELHRTALQSCGLGFPWQVAQQSIAGWWSLNKVLLCLTRVYACSCSCGLLPEGTWPGCALPQGRVEEWHRLSGQLHPLCTRSDHRGDGINL
jgi:hypothetical protein